MFKISFYEKSSARAGGKHTRRYFGTAASHNKSLGLVIIFGAADESTPGKTLTNGLGLKLCPQPMWFVSCFLWDREVLVTGEMLPTGAEGCGDGIEAVTGDTDGLHVPPPL